MSKVSNGTNCERAAANGVAYSQRACFFKGSLSRDPEREGVSIEREGGSDGKRKVGNKVTAEVWLSTVNNVHFK